MSEKLTREQVETIRDWMMLMDRNGSSHEQWLQALCDLALQSLAPSEPQAAQAEGWEEGREAGAKCAEILMVRIDMPRGGTHSELAEMGKRLPAIYAAAIRALPNPYRSDRRTGQPLPKDSKAVVDRAKGDRRLNRTEEMK